MATHVELLGVAIDSQLKTKGESLANNYNKSVELLLAWVKHLHSTQLTGNADYMLEGVGSLIRETAAYISMGLIRAAMFSIRGQIDLIFSWLYFKDHPVELKVVETTGEGYKLVSEIILFLNKSYTGYGGKMTVLEQISQRKSSNPYHLLSGHVHGQSKFTIPGVNQLSHVVFPETVCDEVIHLQSDSTEYINDILLSLYAKDWASVPAVIQSNLISRKPTDKQKAVLFA